MGPLSGVVVLDLGQYLAGPFGPMVLADLGAEVIKVEPVRGNRMRMARGMPLVGCRPRQAFDFAVDVKSSEGLEAVLRLGAEIADVVHHNMTKGTAARLGVDYESLESPQPRPRPLQHLRLRSRGGRCRGVSAAWIRSTRLRAVFEFEAGPVAGGNPGRCTSTWDDRHRQRHGVRGRGARRPLPPASYRQGTGPLDIASQRCSRVRFRRVPGGAAQPGPVRPGLDDNQMGVSPCCRLYETQDGWIRIGPRSAWASGHGSAAGWGARTWSATRRSRRTWPLRRDRMALEPIFRTRTATSWFHDLADAGVDAEISIDTNDGEAVLHDADNERLGLVADYPHPVLGHLRQFGTLIEFSESPTGPYAPPPLVGEHTRRIMERLGYSTRTSTTSWREESSTSRARTIAGHSDRADSVPVVPEPHRYPESDA